MTFTALHADLGQLSQRHRLDANLPDLGRGVESDTAHHVCPRALLTCPGCSHPVHAKTPPTGPRYFARRPLPPKIPEAARINEAAPTVWTGPDR